MSTIMLLKVMVVPKYDSRKLRLRAPLRLLRHLLHLHFLVFLNCKYWHEPPLLLEHIKLLIYCSLLGGTGNCFLGKVPFLWQVPVGREALLKKFGLQLLVIVNLFAVKADAVVYI